MFNCTKEVGMTSVFNEPKSVPDEDALKNALGETYKIWRRILQYTLDLHGNTHSEWKYSGRKFGWSFRISDKKRVLVYLLPRAGFFRVAMVFGNKAFEHIQQSNVSESIKLELTQTTNYAEGRGIRLEIRDENKWTDIQSLIQIKIQF
jgi:hypothetical protein